MHGRRGTEHNKEGVFLVRCITWRVRVVFNEINYLFAEEKRRPKEITSDTLRSSPPNPHRPPCNSVRPSTITAIRISLCTRCPHIHQYFIPRARLSPLYKYVPFSIRFLLIHTIDLAFNNAYYKITPECTCPLLPLVFNLLNKLLMRAIQT